MLKPLPPDQLELCDWLFSTCASALESAEFVAEKRRHKLGESRLNDTAPFPMLCDESVTMNRKRPFRRAESVSV